MPSTDNERIAIVSESRRDAGLVQAVGTWGLSASIVNAVIGAGIFAVPAALAASIGSYAPFAFLICAVAIGSIAICFAEGGSRIPTSGGAYGYIEAAFGPLTGYVAGTLLWFSNALACGSVAAALADVAIGGLPSSLRSPAHLIVVAAVIGCMARVNFIGVSRGGQLIGVLTATKLIPIAVFIGLGASAIHGANFAAPVHPSAAGLGRAVTLALFAFTGMEIPLSASGEIARPSTAIPRALAVAMLFVTAVYVAIQVVAQGILGPALGRSTAPLADGMSRISSSAGRLMLFATGLSMFGWISSDLFGSPRILFAFARDGFLPAVLGRVHRRRHTPHVAIACYAILTIALASVGSFAELAVLSTLAVAVVYILACAAAWRLAGGGVALAGQPLNFPWLRIATIVGITSMFVLIALASRAEILALLSGVGISAGIYTMLRERAGRRTKS